MELLLFGFNHMLEVDVNLDTLELVVGFSFAFKFSGLFHSHPSSISILLYLIDSVRCSNSPLHVTGLDLNHTPCIVSCGYATNLRFRFRHNTILLFQSIFSLLRSSVCWQTFIFKLIENCLSWHRVNLSLFSDVFLLFC